MPCCDTSNSQAAGTAADAGSTAAVEAASGALARALSAATVRAEAWATNAVGPEFLAQTGRDLVRRGESLHAIRMGRDGQPKLVPCASWHWEGSHDPASWTIRATAYGPSTSTTWNLPASAVVFLRWGATAGQPYVGVSPLRWAGTSARLGAEVERALADEAGGPLAHLLPVPADGGDGGDDDSLAALKADIGRARGKALLLEIDSSWMGRGPRRSAAARLGAGSPWSISSSCRGRGRAGRLPSNARGHRRATGPVRGGRGRHEHAREFETVAHGRGSPVWPDCWSTNYPRNWTRLSGWDSTHTRRIRSAERKPSRSWCRPGSISAWPCLPWVCSTMARKNGHQGSATLVRLDQQLTDCIDAERRELSAATEGVARVTRADIIRAALRQRYELERQDESE